jgi:hypothetical protein
MNYALAGFDRRADAVAVPRIWLTLVLSILLHAAALITLVPHLAGTSPWPGIGDEKTDRLEVELVSQPGGKAAPPAAPAAVAAPPARAQAAAPERSQQKPSRETHATLTARAKPLSSSPRPSPPALTVPAPQAPAPPPPTPEPAVEPPRPTPSNLAEAQAAASVGGDLSSFIAARRRMRALEAGAAESDTERRNRIVASNMPSTQSPIDEHRRPGGGIFEITRMTYDDAEFLFFGWNQQAKRRMTQAFEVRLGANSDMRIAVVRKMIELIREYEKGDFRWESYRLGRIIVLSARPEDNAALEEFMLHEFFDSKPEPSPH